MTYDHITPDLGIPWCPTCAPDKDPTREILQTRYCARHDPLNERTDLDEPLMYLTMDDSGNPVLCNLIHRPDEGGQA